MRFLTRHFRNLDGRYHGPEGDAFARHELTPVAARFLRPGARALEVGCGYGRNLVALAETPAGHVVGCDVSHAQLRRAASERIASMTEADRARVSLVRQEPSRLPFRDSSFHLVVLWQVLEHVHGRDAKRNLLAECIRVLEPGGYLLVETPNQWFPVDYHDNKMPLLHWILPNAARSWVTWKIRGERYASEYMSLPAYEGLLRTPQVSRVTRVTRFYFASSWRDAWQELGGTQVGLKRAIFVALLPAHAVLSFFGSSGDLFLPSLRVVWRVDKRARPAP